MNNLEVIQPIMHLLYISNTRIAIEDIRIEKAMHAEVIITIDIFFGQIHAWNQEVIDLVLLFIGRGSDIDLK